MFQSQTLLKSHLLQFHHLLILLKIEQYLLNLNPSQLKILFRQHNNQLIYTFNTLVKHGRELFKQLCISKDIT